MLRVFKPTAGPRWPLPRPSKIRNGSMSSTFSFIAVFVEQHGRAGGGRGASGHKSWTLAQADPPCGRSHSSTQRHRPPVARYWSFAQLSLLQTSVYGSISWSIFLRQHELNCFHKIFQLCVIWFGKIAKVLHVTAQAACSAYVRVCAQGCTHTEDRSTCNARN